MTGRRRRELTDRERGVLAALAEFRVLSGAQLQAVFFPDGSLVGTRRRTQATMKRLTDEGYVNRLERRIGGVRAGSASTCYSLATKGLRSLGPLDGRVRPLREPGLTFVRHHLAIADCWVALGQASHSGEIELLTTQTEPSCWRQVPVAMGSTEWLRPDLFLAIGVGAFEWRWFLEVDLGTESLRRVERTCQRYLAYYRSGAEQATHGVFPKVAWLTDSQRRAEGIGQVLARLPDDDRQVFAVGQLINVVRILKGGES